jgi:hypothetical protein
VMPSASRSLLSGLDVSRLRDTAAIVAGEFQDALAG